jgi:hypothetical protein
MTEIQNPKSKISLPYPPSIGYNLTHPRFALSSHESTHSRTDPNPRSGNPSPKLFPKQVVDILVSLYNVSQEYEQTSFLHLDVRGIGWVLR